MGSTSLLCYSLFLNYIHYRIILQTKKFKNPEKILILEYLNVLWHIFFVSFFFSQNFNVNSWSLQKTDSAENFSFFKILFSIINMSLSIFFSRIAKNTSHCYTLSIIYKYKGHIFSRVILLGQNLKRSRLNKRDPILKKH